MLAAACDIKDTQHEQNTYGPLVRVLGTSIDPTTAEVPADGVIQLSFDRYLLPSTITRQSYAIVDNQNQLLEALDLKTVYDPIARTVTIVGPLGPGVPWLTPGLEYKLVLGLPRDERSDLGGFRAIDRSPLEPSQNRQFSFRAGAVRGATTLDPPVDFCADVLPIFQARCSGATCHGAPAGTNPPRAASSLVLNSHDGLRLSAIGRVAQGANTGARAFTPASDGPVFGVDMALIAPGNPGASWLMYKIEMAPLPVVDAGPQPAYVCKRPGAAVPTPAQPYQALASPWNDRASDAERGRLGDYVLGREMPYPPVQPLTFQERQRIRMWITAGAEVRDCGDCTVVEPPDGGT
ncbi:MAG: hypothetical protein KIT84_33245 [Labilithrix sp.]|nr:hypothetical protein [Labilithrix sp.]MCW5815913.1 hypothetical protein [Labilithrix sp.]